MRPFQYLPDRRSSPSCASRNGLDLDQNGMKALILFKDMRGEGRRAVAVEVVTAKVAIDRQSIACLEGWPRPEPARGRDGGAGRTFEPTR